MHRVGLDRRHLALERGRVLLRLAHVDREQARATARPSPRPRRAPRRASSAGSRDWLLAGDGRGGRRERGGGASSERWRDRRDSARGAGGRAGASARHQVERLEGEGLARLGGDFAPAAAAPAPSSGRALEHRRGATPRLSPLFSSSARRAISVAVDRRSLPVLSCSIQPGERPLGELDEVEKARRGRLLVLQPLVHHLLALPRDLAEVGEADHAAAALERVEAAPDRGERLAVVRRAAAGGEMLRDRRRRPRVASSRKISSSSLSTSAPGASTSCTTCGVGVSGGFSGASSWIAWKTPVWLASTAPWRAASASSLCRATSASEITTASRFRSSTARSSFSFAPAAGRFLPVLVERLHLLLVHVEVQRRHGAGLAERLARRALRGDGARPKRTSAGSSTPRAARRPAGSR